MQVPLQPVSTKFPSFSTDLLWFLGQKFKSCSTIEKSSGQPLGAVISLDSAPSTSAPSFAVLDGGGYRVVWSDPTPTTGDIRLGTVDENLKLGSAGVVETEDGIPFGARLVVDHQNRPIVLWTEEQFSGPDFVSFYRYLTSEGGLAEPSQPVSTDTKTSTTRPLLSLSGDHGLLIWRRSSSPTGVNARAFSIPLFVDGFESGDTSMWSAVVP